MPLELQWAALRARDQRRCDICSRAIRRRRRYVASVGARSLLNWCLACCEGRTSEGKAEMEALSPERRAVLAAIVAELKAKP